MASAAGNTNPSKKRNTFFSQFLSSKNLSIFRNKTSTTTTTTTPPTDNSINILKESQHYKSQININTQQTPVPMCIGRSWLKKRTKRPVSLDLDLAKTFTQQLPINNNGQLVEEHQPSLNDMGTIMVRLSIYLFIGELGKEKKIDRAEILVAKQLIDMSIKQTGKYSLDKKKYP
jgi:hypothetical protein